MTKLCKDCKYMEWEKQWKYPDQMICTHPNNTDGISLLTGKPIIAIKECRNQRQCNAKFSETYRCGREGRFFEQENYIINFFKNLFH